MFKKIKNQFKKIFYSLKKEPAPNLPSYHAFLYQKIIKGFWKPKKPNFEQLTYLPKTLTPQEKKLILILSIIAFLALIFLITKSTLTNLKIVPKVGGSYIEAAVGQPQYINPLLASSAIDLDLTRLIFSGLVKYDSELKIVPDLAKTYEINEEKNIYKFYLRDNLFWHDGTKITSEDVIFTFEKLKNLETKSPFLPDFRGVKIISSGSKIEFQLETPRANFLNYLTIGIVPKHIWQNIETKNILKSSFNLKPVGSGPFRFKSISKIQGREIKSLILEKYPAYHLPGPFIKTFTFKFYRNFDQVAEDLNRQKIDGISYSPIYFKNVHYQINLFKNYSLKLPHHVSLFFNQREENSVLRFKEVRQALAYVTPKEKILREVLSSEGRIIDGPILPEDSGFKEEIKIYEFDPEKAVSLLQKNGWQKNTQGDWTKNGKKIEVSLLTVSQPDLTKTAEIIKEAWQTIGIKVRLLVLPLENIDEALKERKYEAFLYGIVEMFGSDLYNLWHSSQIKYPNLNLSGLVNKRVDELLEKAMTLPFEEVRKKKYAEFQDIIAEEVPAIFLYSTNYNYLIGKKIKGVKIEKINLPADRFNNVSEWYIQTKIKSQKAKVSFNN